jgi:uncharacterized membrane protein YbhN (UPF0104 family)
MRDKNVEQSSGVRTVDGRRPIIEAVGRLSDELPHAQGDGAGHVSHSRAPEDLIAQEVAAARRKARHARWQQLGWFLFGSALFALAVYVLHRWARNVTWDQLVAELAELTAGQIWLAVIFTYFSFIALVGYEIYAVRYVRRRLPLWKKTTYSFITQSLSHAIGFAALVGASLRFRLYAHDGFSLGEVARIQVFFMSTFALGCLVLAGGVLLLEPGVLAEAIGTHPVLWRLAGLVLLVAVGALLVWGALFHRPVRIGRSIIELPTARVTFIQICLGVTDLAFVAAALHVLLPQEFGLTYMETLGIFVAAIAVGLLSHVPGSLGVFEGAVVLLLNPADDLVAPLLGALVAFRAIYYMLPLVNGILLFGALELGRSWTTKPRAAPPALHGRVGAASDGS